MKILCTNGPRIGDAIINNNQVAGGQWTSGGLVNMETNTKLVRFDWSKLESGSKVSPTVNNKCDRSRSRMRAFGRCRRNAGGIKSGRMLGMKASTTNSGITRLGRAVDKECLHRFAWMNALNDLTTCLAFSLV